MSVPDYWPSGQALGDYARRQIQLNPQKYGVMGSFSRELMRGDRSEDFAYAFDQLTYRLATTVLSGRTITEKPVVSMTHPATWKDHAKEAFEHWFAHVLHPLWNGLTPEGERTTPPPWMVLLWPLIVLYPKWHRRHPVKHATMTATVNFRQDILYPEIDAPPQCGRPVIFEEMSLGLPSWDIHSEIAGPPTLQQDPSRFLNRHEISGEFMRDPLSSDPRYTSWGTTPPFQFLEWLERRGVNVDQLVKRR